MLIHQGNARRFSAMLGTLLLSLFALSSGAEAQIERTHIPVIVNYYSNSGLDENDTKVDDAIKRANMILKDAGADMILWVVKEIDPATAGDAGSDGMISEGNSYEEMKDVNKAGKDEVESYKAKNKTGLKVSFVDESWVEDPGTRGWCYTGSPVIVMEEFDVTQMSRTLVHELSHALGNKAHSTGTTDVTNSNSASGDDIPAAWLATMKANRRNIAKCSTQFDNANPNLRDKAQRGQKTDTRGDQGSGGIGPSPGFLDLGTTRLRGLDGENDIDGNLAVDEEFSGLVDALFVLSFDTDNSSGTGFTSGPFSGREMDLELNVTGSGGSYSVTGLVRDLSTNNTTTLPNAPVIDFDELHNPSGSGTADALSNIGFKVPKTLLGLDVNYVQSVTPDDVPVGVYVMSSSLVIDQAEFDYTMNMWLLEPTLQTFGNGAPTPGLPYPFAVSGMNPFDSYKLYLDETLVFSGFLDSTGSDSGSFIFPVSESNLIPHFLTSQDSTPSIGYSSTCPGQPTAIPALTGNGLIALAMLLLVASTLIFRPRQRRST